MQYKILLKQIVLMVTPLWLILFAAPVLYVAQANPVTDNPVALVGNAHIHNIDEPIGVGLPIRLKIPAISVDSDIISVGLTLDGAMDVPKGPADVAWFDLGWRPGDSGSAVIAGHFGWKNKIPAVFDNLHKLNKGDKIYVEDEKGKVSTFVVRESRTYKKDDNPSDVFSSDDGRSHLNLITCMGAWNIMEKTRAKRLVVYSDRE